MKAGALLLFLKEVPLGLTGDSATCKTLNTKGVVLHVEVVVLRQTWNMVLIWLWVKT